MVQTALPGDGLAWPARLLWLTLRAVARERPDIIYAFKPYAVAGLLLLLYSFWRMLSGRSIRLALDLDDWEGSGGWASRREYSWWRRLAVDLMERACIQSADAITAASRELVTLAGRIRADGAAVYLPNCLENDAFPFKAGEQAAARKTLGLPEGPVLLAYSWFLEFDVERMARVFRAVLEQEPKAAALIVGAGERDESLRLQMMLASTGVTDRVRLAGWVPVSELPDYLSAATVAYYPLDDTLLNRAKCPMKLVDLLAAGCPVVADAVGQANEYIEDGVSGRLVPAGDEPAAVEALLEIIRRPELARRLGQAGRERIRSHFRWDHQRETIADLLCL